MKNAWITLAAVCAVVVGVYAYMAQSPGWEPVNLRAADTYYNLLVQGFRAGQLSLKKDIPPQWTHDLSYYKGRFYLYFGVTPALILFWPYVALTGHYLFHRQAVIIFCAVGFLASVGLLRAVWRRYFSEVSIAVALACVLALGLATGAPVMLSWAGVYEVPVSCGYMLTMLELGAIWCALHEPTRRSRWLAAASVTAGLAVGARPTLLFSAVILLAPVILSWRERRPVAMQLLAAIGPMAVIVVGLLVYNFRRFENPFEFGMRYQLGGKPEGGESLMTLQLFSLRYLWFNFRVFFLEPARWSTQSPFVHDIVVPPLPTGHFEVGRPFGVLTNIPVVWLALAVPLAWRNRSTEAASILRWFVVAATVLVGICALTLGLFCSAMFRYEVDFLPALLVLAVVGILGVERALAGWPVWRRVARFGWGLLLVFSVAFNLLASVGYYAEGHFDLGGSLWQAGELSEAIEQYQQALRIRPDYAEARYNLGDIFLQQGKVPEAIEQYEQVLRIQPDHAKAHNNLGNALLRMGRVKEAIGHNEEALRLMPDSAEVHYSLGNALFQAKQVEEATELWKQAVRIKPDFAEAHYNLGIALAQTGRVPEAIIEFEQVLRIKPDYTQAREALARLKDRR